MFRLYAFAFFLQLLIHVPYFTKAATFEQTGRQVMHKLLDILTYAAPVGTPTILLLMGRIGYIRMATANLDLKVPEAMQLGCMTDVVCFDKTGTLTHSAVRRLYMCVPTGFVGISHATKGEQSLGVPHYMEVNGQHPICIWFSHKSCCLGWQERLFAALT